MNASPLIIPPPLLSNFSASITNRQHPARQTGMEGKSWPPFSH